MNKVRTQWNGENCFAMRVICTVTDTLEFPQYWARGLVGQRRKVVLVKYGKYVSLLDDEDGQGWYKVTHGGSPLVGSKDLSGENLESREVPEYSDLDRWGWFSQKKRQFLSQNELIFYSENKILLEKFLSDNPQLTESLRLEVWLLPPVENLLITDAENIFGRKEEDSGQEGS